MKKRMMVFTAEQDNALERLFEKCGTYEFQGFSLDIIKWLESELAIENHPLAPKATQ